MIISCYRMDVYDKEGNQYTYTFHEAERASQDAIDILSREHYTDSTHIVFRPYMVEVDNNGKHNATAETGDQNACAQSKQAN